MNAGHVGQCSAVQWKAGPGRVHWDHFLADRLQFGHTEADGAAGVDNAAALPLFNFEIQCTGRFWHCQWLGDSPSGRFWHWEILFGYFLSTEALYANPTLTHLLFDSLTSFLFTFPSKNVQMVIMTEWLFKTETVQSLRIICLVSLVSDDQWSPYSTDVQTDQLTSTILTRSMSLFAHPDELHWDVMHRKSVAIESNVVLRCRCRSAYLVRPVPPHPSSYSALCPPLSTPNHPIPPPTKHNLPPPKISYYFCKS